MPDHYILEGHTPIPATLMEWANWFEENFTKRRVAKTTIGKYDISTVFLGINHRFGDKGPPLLFETMVFEKGKHDERWMARCSTWKEAEAQHAEACKWVSIGDFDVADNR